MIRHSDSNRDTGVSYLILTALFLTGTVQFELDLSPNNGTIVTIGSNVTFTCSVIPCNETGSAVLSFGHVEQLFSGLCTEIFNITARRFEFSCNSTQCMYSLNVYDVDFTDHKRPMLCTYRSFSEDILNKTTTINVLDDTYNFTTISPPGPFVDGESVNFKCCFERAVSPNITWSFQCHGELTTLENDNCRCINVIVSIDMDKNSTKCTCSAQSGDMSINVSSELQLVINQYDPLFELSKVTNVDFGNTATLTCHIPGLQYPFDFGHWQYQNGREVNSFIGSTSSNQAILLTFDNCTYEEMGKYYCTVIDVRKNYSIVANTSTELYVQGPITLKKIHTEHVNATLCSITVTFESFPNINIESLWTNNRKVQFQQDKSKRFVMKEMEKFSTEQERVINMMDCPSSNFYGMIVSNGVFSEKFYFNKAGDLYNITLMLKMEGQFIDGEQASISCFDIIQSDASSLDLSCDNVTNIAKEENDDATLIRNVFTADLKDDNTICRCSSNKSNSQSMLNIHIFPYKGYNVSHRKEMCVSNSEIKLTCQDDNLPDVFHFGKWFHHYNGVDICKLAGFSSGKKTSIQIPFCTYEDIGNYTCSITDTRKNTTVFYLTTFLSVPGPPVIVNSSIVKHESKAECLLSVEFYSFDEISTLTWYKNGRLLHSSEHQRPNVRLTAHIVNMHNKDVPVKAKIATLQLKPVCDVDTSMYRLTVKTAHFSTSHTFEQEDNTVHTVLIMSLLIATGIVITGLIIIICRFTKVRKGKFRFNRKSLYTSNAVVGRRIDTQFYEEIDMFIENLRQADEETTGHNRYTISENEYEQIPFDRE